MVPHFLSKIFTHCFHCLLVLKDAEPALFSSQRWLFTICLDNHSFSLEFYKLYQLKSSWWSLRWFFFFLLKHMWSHLYVYVFLNFRLGRCDFRVLLFVAIVFFFSCYKSNTGIHSTLWMWNNVQDIGISEKKKCKRLYIVCYILYRKHIWICLFLHIETL